MLRPSLERLYALSLDPARAWAHRDDLAVRADGLAVIRFGAYHCNIS